MRQGTSLIRSQPSELIIIRTERRLELVAKQVVGTVGRIEALIGRQSQPQSRSGSGHGGEVTASDGWTPMGFVLKRITGINPFTVFAVRMGERLTAEEKDPRYRFATAHGLIKEPTIFVDTATGRTLGDESFDAFVFWPRTQLVNGRPDWLQTVLGRRRVPLPPTLSGGSGVRLVQAFRDGERATAIPVDQVLLDDRHLTTVLTLPLGSYWARTIDRTGAVIGTSRMDVK